MKLPYNVFRSLCVIDRLRINRRHKTPSASLCNIISKAILLGKLNYVICHTNKHWLHNFAFHYFKALQTFDENTPF